MKRTEGVLFTAAILLVFSGYGTAATAASPLQAVETGGKVSGVAGTGAADARLRPAAPARQQHAAVVSAMPEPVRVMVRTVADGKDAAQVAVLLVGGVQRALAAPRYSVVNDGPAEIVANLGVTCGPAAAQTGAGYKGACDVSVVRSSDLVDFVAQARTDVVARDRFEVTETSGNGPEDTLKSLVGKMNGKVSPWLADTCEKIGGKLEILVVTLSNARYVDTRRSDYPTHFSRRLRGLGGVFDCKILASDAAKGTLQARVVYDKTRFPDGFVNRLYKLPDLNLRR
ncbi:MAG: hypothetical protein PHV28_09860 [Kiritimatiellae bacterium]|nr:hypothetical protein [Kiritimatiellia bacterium]